MADDWNSSDDWKTPAISSSALMDNDGDDYEERGRGVGTTAGETGSSTPPPLKPGAGDAPKQQQQQQPQAPARDRFEEPKSSGEIAGDGWMREREALPSATEVKTPTPPFLAATKIAPHPDSTSAPQSTGPVAETRGKGRESADESFFSPPSVAPECVMQSSAEFSVNLKDQPVRAKPVGPQDAAPVHVETVPVFSVSSFSSADSITELTISTKAVQNDDLTQTEALADTVSQTISGFMESTMDKQVADGLEKVQDVIEKMEVKPAFSESVNLESLISVGEYESDREVESSGNEFEWTVLSVAKENVPEKAKLDEESLTKISKIAGVDDQLQGNWEVGLETNMGLTSYEEASGTGLALDKIVEQKEFMQNVLTNLNEQILEPVDSGLNFCYGDILEVKGRMNLMPSSTEIEVTMIDTDVASESTFTVFGKPVETVEVQEQADSEKPCDTEKQTGDQDSGKLGYADLESVPFIQQSLESDGKEKPSLADKVYFAVSVKGEPQTDMTYATFDSYNVLEPPRSAYLTTNNPVPEDSGTIREKSVLEEASAAPQQLATIKSEVDKEIKLAETKSSSPIDNASKLVSKIVPSASEMYSLDGLAVTQEHTGETEAPGQTLQDHASDNLQTSSAFKLHQSAIGVEKTEEVDVAQKKESRDSLDPFKALYSMSEWSIVGEPEKMQGLKDTKAPSHLESVNVTECATTPEEPRHGPVQAVAQSTKEEQIVHAFPEQLALSGRPAHSITGVSPVQDTFEELGSVSVGEIGEGTVVVSEQVPVCEEGDFPVRVSVSSTIVPEVKVENSLLFGYREPDSYENMKPLPHSFEQVLLTSEFVEDFTLIGVKPEVSADTLEMKCQYGAVPKEIISKSEPELVLGTEMSNVLEVKSAEQLLPDYEDIEQFAFCSLLAQEPIEIPTLIKDLTEEVLTGPLHIEEKAATEIKSGHQQASGETSSRPTETAKYTVQEAISALTTIENIATPLIAEAEPTEDIVSVAKGPALEAVSEESDFVSSQPIDLMGTLSLQGDTFTDNFKEKQDKVKIDSTSAQPVEEKVEIDTFADNFKEKRDKVKIDSSSARPIEEKVEIEQGHLNTQEVSPSAVFPINEEVTKASKEVVTKILETSVALAEVLGKEERARTSPMGQQEVDVLHATAEEAIVSKKYVPPETVMSELPPTAESSEVSSADPDIADRSVKLNKKSVVDLIYWRDIKKTGLVFGASLFLLLSMTIFSIVSVIAYLALALLSVTVSFRIYKGVLQAVQKSDDGHPFKGCLETDVTVSEDLIHKYSDVGLGHVNRVLTELRRLFLVQDLVDSLKFSVLMWLLTYVGALFNGLTLLIIALVAVFSIPVVYERHQTQIDHYIGMVSKQVKEVTAKIQAKVPGLKRKPE
uniref:Reticulon n=1 Tax=Callorhinchus milii TaxID=7868 RepID=A0A4W3GTT0_CALMI|eukprot:gi/632950216/ref/XP_007890596.1/ PREDICTED: reticulon-4 isoform X2 [Callorhinchus milii]